ncbi:unnamed protein product [Nezara viridula]|uniref:Uncharacterized protein n=1 Tax=Nezara viridula TaxID=85310 RepID=A0A9P0H4R0_NEZVI|nr:unnamed protein product [Nezara viridula]
MLSRQSAKASLRANCACLSTSHLPLSKLSNISRSSRRLVIGDVVDHKGIGCDYENLIISKLQDNLSLW